MVAPSQDQVLGCGIQDSGLCRADLLLAPYAVQAGEQLVQWRVDAVSRLTAVRDGAATNAVRNTGRPTMQLHAARYAVENAVENAVRNTGRPTMQRGKCSAVCSR